MSTVTDAKKLAEQIAKAKKAINTGIVLGLKDGGAMILNNAIKRTPIEFGNLRRSATIIGRPDDPKSQSKLEKTDEPKWKDENDKAAKQKAPGTTATVGSKLKQYLTAGWEALKQEAATELAKDRSPAVMIGFGAYYSIFVHEDLNATHKKGEAKFLEKAQTDERENIKTRIMQRIAQQLRQAVANK